MPHFEETYGFAPDQMTERERFIALYGALHDLKIDHKQAIDGIYKRLDEANGKVRKIPELSECVNHHKLYFKIWAAIGVPVGIALLIAFFKFVLNL